METCRGGGKVRVTGKGLDKYFAFFLDVTTMNFCFMRLRSRALDHPEILDQMSDLSLDDHPVICGLSSG